MVSVEVEISQYQYHKLNKSKGKCKTKTWQKNISLYVMLWIEFRISVQTIPSGTIWHHLAPSGTIFPNNPWYSTLLVLYCKNINEIGFLQRMAMLPVYSYVAELSIKTYYLVLVCLRGFSFRNWIAIVFYWASL